MAGGAGGAAVTASFAARMNSNPNAFTFVSITIVMMGALMFGIDQTNFGLVQTMSSFSDEWCPKFQFKGGIDCATIGTLEEDLQPQRWRDFIRWGGSLIPIGMSVGCLTLGPVMARRCGRRLTISVGSLTCFLGCTVVAFFSPTVTVFYIGRFLTGYGCGMACYCLPMYQSEVATVGIRGWTGGLYQFCVAFGGLVTTIFLAYVKDWKHGFMLPGYAGLVVGVCVWLCPESPRFVIDRFGKDAGRPVLQRVRRGDVEAELDFIVQTAEAEKQSGSLAFKELFTKPGLNRRVFTACYMQIAQQLTGINAFLTYQNNVYNAANIDPSFVNAAFGPQFILSVFMLVGCTMGLAVVDSSMGGRRKQLIAASALMGPPLVIGAVAGWMDWSSWITVAALFVFGFGFQFAWGIIPWFYPAEIFTMREKEYALSLSTACNFILTIVITVVTPSLLRSPYMTFFLFGVLNITNIVFVLACVKETKGVPLDEVPGLFGGHDSKDTKTETLCSA